jgi:hypothetical protein
MMPTDEALHEAVRRADSGWPAGHLDAGFCPPALLAPLLRHEDPGCCTWGWPCWPNGHLRHTAVLLGDDRPDVVRTAIRTPGHAAWAPVLAAVTARLEHSRPAMRKAAADGLVRTGAVAVPALRHAADHARADRRSRYTELLARIAASAG